MRTLNKLQETKTLNWFIYYIVEFSFFCRTQLLTRHRFLLKVSLTFLDFSKDPIHYCSPRSLGLSALLVVPVLLFLFAGAGGQVWAVFPAIGPLLLSPPTPAHRLTTGHATTTASAAGHLQALGTDRLPVTGIATAAGVWIWGVPLPAWPGYLGDDTGLNSPRTESGRLMREGDLQKKT